MVINIDFDGTCVTHSFPLIGEEIGAAKVLKRLTNHGHKLILFTMRSDSIQSKTVNGSNTPFKDNYLTEAVKWFDNHSIPLYGIQSNPTQHYWTNSPKSYAELMIDDSALGCPLKNDRKLSKKPFVDWEKVEKHLENMGLFKKLLK
jgi:hypothetical protein